MKPQHHPRRTCLGCGSTDDQSALLRLVVGEDGELRVDRLGEGRGGYLHMSENCWKAFLRRKSLHRAFHREVGREAKERLIRALRNGQRE